MFRLAHPAALLFLFLPLGLWALRYFGWPQVSTPLLTYSDIRLVINLTSDWRVRLRRLPDAVRAVAWLLLVVVLARPQMGNTQEITIGQGVDIVLALDISGSMAATDFGPQNRLEIAKDVIADFVQGREFDRIGLVVFARNAFYQSPPTLDYNVLIGL